ncbi:MAG TPA: RIP metalloprotease RseP, partial [Planctomycetota bacterium]|nr:RIP metalloprotease RseP [Planctomycetota bacterium]
MIQTLRIIEILIGVGVLIMIHELGHFLAAKWAGVRVDKFALGLGPKIVSFQRGETEYSIRWIPIGGFCALAGEEPGSETNAPPERQFRNQSPGKRAVILFAGVLMNFLLAIVLFSLAFGIGVKFPRALIGRVEPGSPAEQAGLRPGDEIIGIDGDRDVDFQDLKLKTMLGDPGDRLTLTVLRHDTDAIEDVVVTTVADEKQGTPVIGVQPACGRTLLEVEKDGAAAEAGLRDGDVIVEVGGKTPLAWNDLLLYLSVHVGKPVTVEVDRDGKPVTTTLRPRTGHRGSIGITPQAHPAVQRVLAGRPADGKLKCEDRILKVAGREVHTVRDLLGLTARAVGVETVYTVRRGEETIDVTLTPTVTEGSLSATIGAVVSSPTDFTVGAVEEGSPAGGVQIRPGDVLVGVGRLDLTTGKVSWDLVQLLLDEAAREGEKIEVRWKSGGSVWHYPLEVRRVEDPLTVD